MTRDPQTNDRYAGRNIDFDAILFEGALGGISELNNYLDARGRQISRKISESGVGANDRLRYALVAEAIEEAKRVLPVLLSDRKGIKGEHPDTAQK